MKKLLLYALFIAGSLLGCAKPGVYVLFAQNAKSDDAMRHSITLRLPMERTPAGTKLFCWSPSAWVYAQKMDEYRVRVRETDGEERITILPSDGSPSGFVTIWPEHKATRCGLNAQSPIGANGYLMWGEFTLFFERTGEHTMKYWVGDDVITLSYPLKDDDRPLLRKKSVPSEVADLLY